MNKLIQKIWPYPEKISEREKKIDDENNLYLDQQIKDLDFNKEEGPVYLEAARRILEEENGRKSGAEARATTFIAAVAALIPLMTWALSSSSEPVCSPGAGCIIWSLLFILAVIYFIFAAYCALLSIAVANYHVIGVEDIVGIKKSKNDVYEELIQKTLLHARKNRETINQKLAFIKVAQYRFFNGLIVLGFLLMFDPLSRFGIVRSLQYQFQSWMGGIICLSPSNQNIEITNPQK